MTSTSTTGAASELLPVKFTDASIQGMIDALTNIRRTVQQELRGAVAKDIFDFADEALSSLTRTPAPVTEGAQREAVAWQCRPRGLVNGHPWHWRECDEQDFREKTYCGSVPDEWEFRELFIAPPPPDRVQPERVEADKDWLITLLLELRSRDVGADLRTRTDNAIAELQAAPPTDASGGVTDWQVEQSCKAAYSECDMGPFPEQAADPASDRRFVRAALEAADRARKPGYRQVTLEDARTVAEKYATTRLPKDSPLFVEMLAALRSIGAVIPDAGK